MSQRTIEQRPHWLKMPPAGGRSNRDSVTQTEGLATVTEGLPVKLNYQTTDSAPFLFWYVQYVQASWLPLRSSTDNKRTEHQVFHATLQKSNSSFPRHRSSVQLWDSALYFCALSGTGRETAGEAAHKPRLSLVPALSLPFPQFSSTKSSE
ncbi:hypothetical protein U0070_007797 [Myodes glareolus]|uniref:Ig-like domain-containing protein n=1 Tax=Myodes glareolus TaxID=447135 RepID=A0AAW0ILH0_MYOGA